MEFENANDAGIESWIDQPMDPSGYLPGGLFVFRVSIVQGKYERYLQAVSRYLFIL
jgi:hypothetical protein